MILGAMLGATSLAAYARAPHRKIASIGPHQLDRIVPGTVGGWRFEGANGIVLPPPDDLARLLYDQQLARFYVSEHDQPVMMVAAYGSSQGGMLQVHRPEICYPASGFRLTATRTVALPLANGRTLPTRAFSAHSDTRTEQVLYWTRVGDALPTSWTSQRIAIMESNLGGEVPDGLLVRISTNVEDPDQGMRILARFAEQLLAAAGPSGRRKLIGNVYTW